MSDKIQLAKLNSEERATLRRFGRRRLIEAAEDSFSACNGDRDQFEAVFRKDHRLVGLDLATIIILVKLALMLFDWWMSRRKEPNWTVRGSVTDDMLDDVEGEKS